MYEPLIASNSDTDPEHDSDSSEDGCSIWQCSTTFACW